MCTLSIGLSRDFTFIFAAAHIGCIIIAIVIIIIIVVVIISLVVSFRPTSYRFTTSTLVIYLIQLVRSRTPAPHEHPLLRTTASSRAQEARASRAVPRLEQHAMSTAGQHVRRS
jgi:hypothetical protein